MKKELFKKTLTIGVRIKEDYLFGSSFSTVILIIKNSTKLYIYHNMKTKAVWQ